MRTSLHAAPDRFAPVKTPLGLTALTWVLFVGLDIILGGGMPVASAGATQYTAWWLVANAITAAVLGFLASRAPWRGPRLALALAAIPLAIQAINVIEGIAYLKLTPAATWTLALSPAKYLLVFPLWLALAGQPVAGTAGRRAFTLAGTVWRLVLSSVAYLMLYLIAGILILPLVKDFYATQTLPPIGVVITLQLFLRGPLFTAICLLLARLIGGRGITTVILVGLAFTAVSGIAPLIVPSSFFPDAVRWVHFGEVTVANLLFGCFVARLWLRGPAARSPAIAESSSPGRDTHS